MMSRYRTATAIAVSVMAMAASGSGTAVADTKALAEFYKGKTVTVHFGGGVGGSYWLYSQLAASHLGRFIPGNPNLVIQAMPGSGGIKGLNYSFNVAPRDGSFITMAHAEVLQETILNPKSKFHAGKYEWIGRFTNIDSIGVASKASGVTSLDVAMKREVNVGATGMRSWTGFAPMLFNRVAGTKFRVVAGYKGASVMFQALDQREIDVAPVSWVAASVGHAGKLKSGEYIPIFAIALKRMPQLPDVPTITEFGRDEGEKLFLKVFAANGMIGRALAAPPGTNAERVQALRDAFDRMLADKQFRDYVASKRIPLNPMAGTELGKDVASVLAMEPAQIEKTRAVYNEMLEEIKTKKPAAAKK